MPLREFAGLISKHFTDMEMVDTRKDKKPYVGMHSILGNVTLGESQVMRLPTFLMLW